MRNLAATEARRGDGSLTGQLAWGWGRPAPPGGGFAPASVQCIPASSRVFSSVPSPEYPNYSPVMHIPLPVFLLTP